MERFKNILLVIDDKIENETAIRRAVNLAINNQANVTALKILDLPMNIAHFFETYLSSATLKDHLQEQTDRVKQELEPYKQDMDIDIKVVQGKFFLEIIRSVIKHDFDLVIKTCHHHGELESLLFGSTDMHLLRKCPCPVWLIKPRPEAQCKRILVALDIQPSEDDERLDTLNQQLMEMSISLAVTEKAKLHFTHAWMVFDQSMVLDGNFPQLKDEFAEWVKEQKDEINLRIKAFEKKLNTILGTKDFEHLQHEVHIVEGDAYETVPKMVEEKNIDLVIMGTVARTGLSGVFMGNTAESILNQINCSVLTIKPEGFVSPVTLQ